MGANDKLAATFHPADTLALRRPPKRIQMSRQHPWRKDNPDAVIVARPTAFGNPFAVGSWFIEREGKIAPTAFPQFHPSALQVVDRATAVDLFRRHVRENDQLRELISRLLVGRDLACWCPLDGPCHADVELELANLPRTHPAGRNF